MRKWPWIIETDQFRIEVGKHVAVGSLSMPTYVEARFYGVDEPDNWVRVELRDNVPRIVALGWLSAPNAREVMSKDVRDLDFSYVIDTLYTAAVRDKKMSDRASSDADIAFETAVRHSLQERRTGKRRIDTEFLREVAKVYRANIDHAPVQAVSRTFGVKHRQASDYANKARERKLLPPTEQGKAKA